MKGKPHYLVLSLLIMLSLLASMACGKHTPAQVEAHDKMVAQLEDAKEGDVVEANGGRIWVVWSVANTDIERITLIGLGSTSQEHLVTNLAWDTKKVIGQNSPDYCAMLRHMALGSNRQTEGGHHERSN